MNSFIFKKCSNTALSIESDRELLGQTLIKGGGGSRGNHKDSDFQRNPLLEMSLESSMAGTINEEAQD